MTQLNKKTILPKIRRDRLHFGLLVTGIPFVFCFEIFAVLPTYHPDLNWKAIFHLISAVFFLFNIAGNTWMLLHKDTGAARGDLPTILKTDWKYCPICQINSPPRSYHCPDCEECILKYDHHCSFIGYCIGYFNQRFYLVLIINIWVCAIYCLIFHWEYCWDVLGGFTLPALIYLIGPHFSMIFGFLGFSGFLIASYLTLNLIVIALSSYLVYKQFLQIQNGQTTYERKHNVTKYNLGWKRNLTEVLGNKWFLAFIIPFFPSRLPGNGLSFLRSEDWEDVKNM